MHPIQTFSNAFWKTITPVFPFCRDLLARLGVIHNVRRQNFHLGWLAPGRTVEGLRAHVAAHGFGNHFVAWVDTDEVLGLRKRVDFQFQYHLRVFADREIRGHHEWTPESSPFKHYFDVDMQPKTEDFQAFLGDWLVTEPPADAGNITSQIAPAALRTGPRNG